MLEPTPRVQQENLRALDRMTTACVRREKRGAASEAGNRRRLQRPADCEAFVELQRELDWRIQLSVDPVS
jgi:hypothetical protein